MSTDTLAGAIQSVLAWWPGDDTNYVLLGFSVKTWGRVGKLMQYTGGLVALVEILGEERLQVASEKMHALAASLRKNAARFVILASVLVAFALPSLQNIGRIVRSVPLLQGTPSGLILAAVFLSPLILGAIVACLPGVAAAALIGLGRLSASTISLKTIGFVIVTIGFALDFLAS